MVRQKRMLAEVACRGSVPGKSLQQVGSEMKASGNAWAAGDVLTMEGRVQRTRELARSSRVEQSPPKNKYFTKNRHGGSGRGSKGSPHVVSG